MSRQNLSLSNLDKDLYPPYGFTKAHVLDYYRRAAPFILPHLKNRALTLKRFPNGVREDYFFEKHCPDYRPSWVATADISPKQGEIMTVCMVNNLDTLMWVGNLASLELHVPLAQATSPDRPDAVVFDLDPGEGAGLAQCAQVALILQNLFHELKLSCFAKTSGMKGLHVFVPLHQKRATFEDTKIFSKSVALVIERAYPELVTSKMAKGKRSGKVFINWSQNDSSKTMVCVYSLRAAETPAVSFPLSWEDIRKLTANNEAPVLPVTPVRALSLLEHAGDLFSEVLVLKQNLPKV